MSELHFRSATELCHALRRKEVSSVELLDHTLARVATLNPRINAVVHVAAERARERARAADAARAHGESWGALHGLPITIKDSFEVAGMPCASGAPELAKHVPAKHATAVQRLTDAGAVVFGKTNLPLYAGDFQSYNAVYGTTNNPWDVARGPGGSSGGSAAALAAGLTGLELGSDIGGSIRNPSHYCGVYGHKTTHGIVPIRGHIPARRARTPRATSGSPGRWAEARPTSRSASRCSRAPTRATRRRGGSHCRRRARCASPTRAWACGSTTRSARSTPRCATSCRTQSMRSRKPARQSTTAGF